MTIRAVRAGQRESSGSDDRTYVFAGGVLRAEGGRVFVGSGGRCIASGGARVTLVDDGISAVLVDRPAPEAWVDGGSGYADAGILWIGGAATFEARGHAVIHATAEVQGRVIEGRLVDVTRVTGAEFDAALTEVARPTWDGVARDALDPEPDGDPAKWLTPVAEALEDLGARPGDALESHGHRTLALTSNEPTHAAIQLLGKMDLPPTVQVQVRDRTVRLVTDYGVSLVIAPQPRSAWSPRLRRKGHT